VRNLKLKFEIRNVVELEKKLMKLPKSYYSLNGKEIPDAFHLFKDSKSWEKDYILMRGNRIGLEKIDPAKEVWEICYINERGGRSEVELFQDEQEACEYFYWLLKRKRLKNI